jgi:anti-sigma regulatory factor (Ser/Thr protein kinase)
MTASSELRVVCVAHHKSAAPLRHALAAFLNILEVDADYCQDILTAVGEALANAVEHAYAHDTPLGDVELSAKIGANDTLAIDVSDQGTFVQKEKVPGRSFGLRIVRSIAREVVVDTNGGTHVRMIFQASR